jgi:pimeloyl-ACP methyl ester carboxylesterase
LADSSEQVTARYAAAEQVAKQGLASIAESMPAALTSKPELQVALKKIIERQKPPGVIGALKAMAARPEATSVLSSFEFPVLVVTGLADTLIPPQRAYQMQASAPGVRVVAVPGAGHMPMMDAPQETAQALKTLL